jgi:hypothetical protein
VKSCGAKGRHCSPGAAWLRAVSWLLQGCAGLAKGAFDACVGIALRPVFGQFGPGFELLFDAKSLKTL